MFSKLFGDIALEGLTTFRHEKTLEKPLKNHAQTKKKSMKKTCCFWMSSFSHFSSKFNEFGTPKWSPKSPFGHQTLCPTDFRKDLENVFFSNHAPEAPEVDFGASRGGFGVDLEHPGMLKFNISADSFLLT